jgi:hypothetical protein
MSKTSFLTSKVSALLRIVNSGVCTHARLAFTLWWGDGLRACTLSFADKLWLTRRSVGRAFNSRCGSVRMPRNNCETAKQPDLKLKILPEQLSGSLPLTALSALLLRAPKSLRHLLHAYRDCSQLRLVYTSDFNAQLCTAFL